MCSCWSVGSCGMARLGRPPKQLPPPFPRTGSLALALSPPPPSHVPPAAPSPVSAAAGGLTGVGGGADMTGRRGVRFARFAWWAPSGTHLFLGIAISWTMRMFTPSCCQGRFCSHCAHSHLTSLTLPPIFTLNLNFRSKPKVCTYSVLGPDPYASLAP